MDLQSQHDKKLVRNVLKDRSLCNSSGQGSINYFLYICSLIHDSPVLGAATSSLFLKCKRRNNSDSLPLDQFYFSVFYLLDN